MVEKQTKTITINNKEYTEDQLNDEQITMINHVHDLDRKMHDLDKKIRSAQFSLDQMTVGREVFVKMLTGSLENDAEVIEAAE